MSTMQLVPGARPPAGDIAVFWDLENLDGHRLDVAVPAIVEWLSTTGRIVINDAFGDFTHRLAKYRETLSGSRIHAQHVEPRRKHVNRPAERKNLADIVLTLAVAQCVLTKPDVKHVVIVSGDSDFVELAEWCRSFGQFVTGLAGGTVNETWPAACDQFRHFSDLVPELPRPVAPGDARRPLGVGGIVRARRRAVETGRQAAVQGRQVVGRAKGAVVRAQGTIDLDGERELLAEAFRRAGPGTIRQGDLAQIIQHIEPGFSPKRFGRKNYSAMVDAHPDLIAVSGDGRSRALVWRANSARAGRELIDALATRLAKSGRTSLAIGSLKSWALEATGRAFDVSAYGCRSMVEFVELFPDVFAVEVRPAPVGPVAILVDQSPGETPASTGLGVDAAGGEAAAAGNGHADAGLLAKPLWPLPAPATRIAVPMPPPVPAAAAVPVGSP